MGMPSFVTRSMSRNPVTGTTFVLTMNLDLDPDEERAPVAELNA